MVNRRARHLRNDPTEAERRLWRALRRRQIAAAKFRRQAPIGPYIVDFVCFSERLVIEVDGGQHAHRADGDAKRDTWLAEQGFRVLRFWNHDVFENLEGVAEEITGALRNPPHPGPPPQGGRE